MTTAYLLLGSNLGRRSGNMIKALTLLGECGIRIRKISQFYETEPVSKIDQRDYLNLCVEVEVDFSPEKLLSVCLGVEKEGGRTRYKKRPGYERSRIIDIDILLYEDRVIKKRNLVMPHKQMHLRRFALTPLNEIAPQIVHPVQQKTIRNLLKECSDMSIVEIWKPQSSSTIRLQSFVSNA